MCELFKGRCLLTGATGYIGSMISRRLLSQGNEITVIVRDAARLEPEIYDCVQVIQADMSDGEAILQISGKYDYVIHCAAPTKSAYMVSHPVEVTESIVNGTKYILELARRCGAKSVVYVSSMEVYGQIECSKVSRVTEEQMGYIDITDSRSCYPLRDIAGTPASTGLHRCFPAESAWTGHTAGASSLTAGCAFLPCRLMLAAGLRLGCILLGCVPVL